ncbi:AAA family ATPase [Bradyrhizobium sp. AUGA SZCCT0283]|uniref:AAA family ATPase n=1 Tax=Bradyrhizobium sp. AUGA SZCCT0283 TaxID=2807671 RepID=UPI001BACB3BD|nr:AAA family ATPase [Bradyrhizobium sp. AUGA SZCCT0283]MBR1274281.1 AAA family ATPase [Bradyrhizobium sp. AUGA SZCCT0283]
MRFPALSDLDREQRRIYAEAPSDGAILVIGAPGTGKTIMAFHRAKKLHELGQRPKVIMFGSVLMQYTSGGSRPDGDFSISTMHNWAKRWWMNAFRKWPPRELGSLFDIDWIEICSKGLAAAKETAVALDWGHLVIDEGQDFPPEMYVTLGLLSKQLGKGGEKPRVTVFADDNQRLQIHRNSETAGIRKSLFITGDVNRNFLLRKNFRNTKEIAKLAGHFQVGQTSGQAELPERRGDVPSILICDSDQELYDFVARKVKGSPGKQIGVIVCGPSREVTRTYNKLSMRVERSKAKAKVQMYVNGDKKRPASSLDFDSADTVTVLHQQSAKGLEFDIVFFVGLQRMDLGISGGVNERMALYVMCSRARSELFLAFSELDVSAPMPTGMALMPPPSAKLCNYVGVGGFDGTVEKVIAGVEWLAPVFND